MIIFPSSGAVAVPDGTAASDQPPAASDQPQQSSSAAKRSKNLFPKMNDLPPIESVDTESIRARILTVRGVQVMLDRDLAELYGVPTKALNQAVKRNPDRFPSEFVFVLTPEEMVELVTNCDRFSKMKHSSVPMRAFTEHGVIMLASVLRSNMAAFNAQYANSLMVKTSNKFHDRFLIIDRNILIHVGASLNYLGKRCFAFSSLDKSNIPDILAKI